MDRTQLSMVADKCQWVFSESLRNAWGKEARLCRRRRLITPSGWGQALTATCARQHVETIADFHCAFHALWHDRVLLAYRGSGDLRSRRRVQEAGRRVQEAGGFLLFRAKAGMHPQVRGSIARRG